MTWKEKGKTANKQREESGIIGRVDNGHGAEMKRNGGVAQSNSGIKEKRSRQKEKKRERKFEMKG